MARAGEVSPQLSTIMCKRRLATLWFAVGGLLIFVLTLQTVFGKYGEQATEAWGWLLTAILPTMSLILGVLVMDAQRKSMEGRGTDRFLFDLTLALSAVYLVLVALTIFVQPFVSGTAVGLMKQSKLWLSPLQGLVSGSLGAFFVKKG